MSPSGSIIKYNLDTVTVTYFALPLHGLESQFFRQILGLRSLKLRDRECEVFTLYQLILSTILHFQCNSSIIQTRNNHNSGLKALLRWHDI